MKKVCLFLLTLILALQCSQLMMAKDYYAFLELEDELNDYQQYQLGRLGILITARYNGFITVRIHESVNPSDILAITGITHLTKAAPLYTCSDSARYYSKVDPVVNGVGFLQPYTGSGVIMGVIDCGFDFNHINLCNSNGTPRVKAVYMPFDTTGESVAIRAIRLPGSCYEEVRQIVAQTTDDPMVTHGTQVAGIAAGSYKGNDWYGVATDADLVLCGMPEDELNDVLVANCISYINDYANRQNQPYVINLSLGTNVGPHDGSSYLNRVIQQYAGPGHVFVVSAGNDGDDPVCVHSSIQSRQDTVVTLLSGYQGSVYYSGCVNAWGDKNKLFNTRLIVVNTNNGEILYRSRALGTTSSGTYSVISTETDPVLGQYFDGTVDMSGLVEVSGRSSTVSYLNMQAKARNYALGFQYYSPSSTDLVVWTSQYAYFNNYNYSWAEKGSPNGSISDLAATDSVISVGSYNTRQYVPLRDGSMYFRYFSEPKQISYYSSYGPDENGCMRPDVCAPGSVVISSANRYDVTAPNMAYWQPSAYVGGVEFPYCPDLGTSMSAPVVAGAVALWLQANPSLSVADVRNILKNSCYKDDYMTANNYRWGYGKLDVNAGMKYVLHIEDKSGDVDNDGEVTISDVNALLDIILGGSADSDTLRRADVNNDGEIGISDVNEIIDIILN
ncbi:MAG: S8 family serine peptidase [Muribaculaceae bacterium]|nr:S8 family serine peptidase [Muribaculaceae bacterium]